MKKSLFFVAIATLFIASCQKEVEPASQDTSSQSLTITASAENLSTPVKGTINSSNQFIWKTDEKIGLYVNDGGWIEKNQPFHVEEGGATTANFIYDYDEGVFTNTAVTAAFYPWQGTGSSNNNIYDDGSGPIAYFKLPTEYWSYDNGDMLTPLVAPVNYNGAAYDPISFKHAGAAVKLTVNNLVSGTYAVKMTVYNKQITGDFHVNPANAGTDALALDAAENTSLNSVTLHSWKSSGAFSWVFPVPEITKPKLKFEITDGNGVLVWKKSLKAQANDLGRGDILDMPALDVTAYENMTEDATWTFCGNIGGSSWINDVPMYTDGNYSVLSGCTFAVDDEFKIRKDKKWTDEGGDEYPAKGSANWKITAEYAGTKDIIFNRSTHEISVVAHKFPYPAVDLSSYAEDITIDGTMTDWTFWPTLTSTGTDRIRSWKFSSDKDYLYFYLVLRKNRMNTGTPLTIAFDWDSSGSYSADNLSGAEALVQFQPFTNSDNSDGTKPTCVNGSISTATVNGTAGTSVSISAYGSNPNTSDNSDSADYYLEFSILKNNIPSLPVSGTIKIGCGYNWYKTSYQSVTL